MTDPHALATGIVENWSSATVKHGPNATDNRHLSLARELLSALDELDAARKEANAAVSVAAEYLESSDANYDRAEAAEAERDELQAALGELRRRWDELVVAADPSVMENR